VLRRHGHSRTATLDEIAEPADAQAEEEIVRAGARLDMARALRCLTASERRLVALRYVLDLSHAEVAAELGIEEVTARVRLHRARRRLRAVIVT
jgi:RNA polymerase sigma-70 factor (ECF subfamily)